MGIDLILSSKNISNDSTLREPKWDIDSRVPSGKLSIKKINYENHPNTDWMLMDSIPPQTGSTSWFQRNDALGFTGANITGVGARSDLSARYTRAGTFEQACPGYNQIKLQTINNNFEGSTDRAYWIFSKETRDKFGRQSEAGENGTLTVGGENSFLFNKFPLIDSWDFDTSDQAKSFYVDPNFTTGAPQSGPLLVTHSHTESDIQAFYLENGNGGSANNNFSIGNLLQYGMQIWIRRYVIVYNPYAIIHQSVGPRDYLTSDSKSKPPIKFMYFQLFIPSSGVSSMDITEVRLLNTAGINVLQNSSYISSTDSVNSLAVGTNPSSSEIKPGDSLADIIDNSILSNARVGNINDNEDEVIQFKLNREYLFDEFNRLEVYAGHENLPFQIRFLNSNYELVYTATFYSSKPSFSGTDESLIILKMLGPNPLIGFSNSINDNVASYVLSWADELALSSQYIYRKVLEIPFNLGIGGEGSLIKAPMQSLSVAMLKPPESDFSSWFHTAHIHRSATNDDADFVFSPHNNSTQTTSWFTPDNEFTFNTSQGSPTTTPNKWIKGVAGTQYKDWNELMIIAGENTGGQNWYWKFRRDATIVKNASTTVVGDSLAIPPTGTKTAQKWEPYEYFDNNWQTANNGAIFLDNVRVFLMFTWQDDINNTGQEYTPALMFAERDNNFKPAYTNSNNNFALNLYYEVDANWYDSMFALKGGDPANNYRYNSSRPDLRFSGLISLDYYVRNNKEAVKKSYVPDKPLNAVHFKNSGDVSFTFQNTNERGLIETDQSPKNYSLECHICTCDNEK